MPLYKDVDRDSGVVRYEYGADWIEVQFRDGKIYRYTYFSAGVQLIEEMKRLANKGEGLNAYINKFVSKLYESKR